jgi:hypothetical protein
MALQELLEKPEPQALQVQQVKMEQQVQPEPQVQLVLLD